MRVWVGCNEQLCVEDQPVSTARVNATLAAEIPERARRQACEVAIDLHDGPYYGKQAQAAGLWIRGKAKDGTTRFYRCAGQVGGWTTPINLELGRKRSGATLPKRSFDYPMPGHATRGHRIERDKVE